MIELHGWIVIRESYCEENDSESHLKEILEELSKKIFLLKNEVSDIDINLQSKNSIYQVSMFSAANHKG
ncbi:Imm7 family immunity protein [Psychrobacter cibarius]|uniref:Imm7 family immunity protein n=1 Tax=Psychrobacter cibarius TaxID=282669 RepID=UPI0019183BD0|nr:Imm7 family immunity protein [Psychrobacter cibarius]